MPATKSSKAAEAPAGTVDEKQAAEIQGLFDVFEIEKQYADEHSQRAAELNEELTALFERLDLKEFSLADGRKLKLVTPTITTINEKKFWLMIQERNVPDDQVFKQLKPTVGIAKKLLSETDVLAISKTEDGENRVQAYGTAKKAG